MKILMEKEAEDFLERLRFPIAKRTVAKTKEDVLRASSIIKYPIALKIIGNILHKSDVGGVELDLQNENQVLKAFDKIRKIKNFEAVLVQKYIPGEYILIGLKKDPSFGHVLVAGLGGIYTEIIKDVSMRVCPINKNEALEMLKELKSYKILTGIRGKKKVNINKIMDILTRVSNLPKKYPKIKELDINPLVVNHKDATIVDARIIFD